MANCEMLPECLFFSDKLANMPTIADNLKNIFCLGDNTLCARYLIAKHLGKDKIPFDLFPHNTDRVEIILASNINNN